MLKLKSCPKCKGDLLIDKDMYGWYEQCIQCGYQHSLEPLVKVGPLTPEDKNNPVSSVSRTSRRTARGIKDTSEPKGKG